MKFFPKFFAKKEEEKPKHVEYEEIAYSDASEALFGSTEKAIQRYNPSILLSNKGFSVLDKMRRDDQIKAAMTFKKNAVVANGWEVVSPKDKPADWEVTEFVINNLKNMDGTFERRLINILTAMDYGFSVTEKVWEQKDNKINLKAIKTKKPHDITFSADNFGNLTAIEQYSRQLPIDKFIVYSYEMEFDNHYGTPDLESSYRAWWTKDNTYKWMAMLLERMGIPPIFAMYDPTRYEGNKLSQLRDVLSNLQAATTASIPTWNDKETGKSIEFWTPELAKNIGDVFIPSLDMLNRDIARSILMPGLLGVTPDDAVGSQARSTVHFDVFMLVIERIRAEIEEYIMQEQIIKPLVDLNFNVDDYPQFKFMPLTDDLRADLIDKWVNLINANIVKPQSNDEEHIRKLFDFPDRDEKETNDADNEDDDSNNSDNVDNNADDLFSVTCCNNHIDDSDRRKNYEAEFSREKNDYEKKVDFAAISKTINKSEDKLTLELKLILKDEQDYLIKLLRKPKYDIAELSIRTSLTNKLNKKMKDSMLEIAKEGKDNILSIRKFESDVGIIASAAERWIKSRATAVSGVLSNRLQDQVRIIISNAIRSGIPSGEVIAQIQDLFIPYIDTNIVTDTAVITPHRVETIVRTNMTTAYNQGRIVAMRDPEVQEFVHGVEYSAILDDRTTDICEYLDGRVFRVDDPELDRMTPPNHFNCRSLLVPIMIDQPIKKEDFLSPKDIGKARDLAGKGFA